MLLYLDGVIVKQAYCCAYLMFDLLMDLAHWGYMGQIPEDHRTSHYNSPTSDSSALHSRLISTQPSSYILTLSTRGANSLSSRSKFTREGIPPQKCRDASVLTSHRHQGHDH